MIIKMFIYIRKVEKKKKEENEKWNKGVESNCINLMYIKKTER